jgi:hypothetical protein
MDTRLIFRDYLCSIKTDGGTQLQARAGNGSSAWGRREPEWQIRRFDCLEKPLRRAKVSVPQTDTGGRDEYSQALG